MKRTRPSNIWSGMKPARQPRMPLGTLGFRWQEKKGEWNLQMKDGQDGSEIAPALSLQEGNEDVLQVLFDDFSDGNAVQRGVPVRYLETAKGRIPVTRFMIC